MLSEGSSEENEKDDYQECTPGGRGLQQLLQVRCTIHQ